MEKSASRRCPNCGSERTGIDPSDASRWYCFGCREEFQAADEPESVASEPLKLFLSYGHPEAAIATCIKEALEKRGHKVWIDESEIKEGDEWRKKIAEGVRSSNGVIACLSKHSVRNPGVCRDELAIAMSDPSRAITTVLLGDESEVDPPATVTHIQWIDMHDWKEHRKHAGPFGQSFNKSWFEPLECKLYEAVENRDIHEAAREMGKLQKTLRPLIDDSRQRNLLAHEFVGREWLTEEVVEWLDNRTSPRVCLLTGAPGAGKSAFAAHLAHYGTSLRSCVAAALFCEANKPTYNDPNQIIRTLSYLLACKIPEYRGDIAGIIAYEEWPSESEDELFSFLLTDPLTRAIDGGRECLCIIVDGLDEVGDSETNALADTLGRYADRLPDWLKVLVISRDVSSVTASIAGGAHLIDIDASPDSNNDDVRAYLEKILEPRFKGDPSLEDSVDAIIQKSEGTMLYASLVADSLIKGKMSLKEASASLPKGLNSAFHNWFKCMFPDIKAYKSHFRSELGCLLAAPGGALPEEELERLSNRDADAVNDFKLRLEAFLQEGVSPLGGPALSISHAYLAEWLNSKAAGNYRAAKEAGIKKMGETFSNTLRNTPEDLTDYEAANMLDLLAQAGASSKYEEACNSPVLCDRICDLCTSLFLDGRLSMAERLAKNASNHFRDSGSGSQLIKLAKSMGALALATRRESPWDPIDADMLFDAALSVYDKLEENDPDVSSPDLADAYNNFAAMYQEQQSWNADAEIKAEEFYRRAYDARKKLAESDPSADNLLKLAESSSNLGQFLTTVHQHAKAEKLLRESVDQYEHCAKDKLGEILPGLAESRTDLALLLQEEGKLDESEELHRQALADFNELARNDPDAYLSSLADSCFNVATLCMVTGKLDEAGRLYSEYSEAYRKLAQNDPLVYSLAYAESGIYLAHLHEANDKPADAAKLYNKTANIFNQHPQAEHNDYLSCRAESCICLASLYESARSFNEAERLYRENVEISEELAEIDDLLHGFDPYASYTKLAAFFRRIGKIDEAEGLYRKAITICKNGFEFSEPGMFSLEIAKTCIDLASILISRGDREEALSCYREAILECEYAETYDDPRGENERNALAEQAREQVRRIFGEDALESLRQH